MINRSTSLGVRCSRLRRCRFATRRGGATFPFSMNGETFLVRLNVSTVLMSMVQSFPIRDVFGQVVAISFRGYRCAEEPHSCFGSLVDTLARVEVLILHLIEAQLFSLLGRPSLDS